jgi:hypothetical protein
MDNSFLYTEPISGTTGYLGRWYDSGLELPPDLDDKRIVHDEVERLTFALSSALIASTLSRRLGGVSDDELALDKKRSRRTAHALKQALRSWSGNQTPQMIVTDDVRQRGAQVDWSSYVANHSTAVHGRACLAATWAIRTHHERWGKTAIVRYTNELSWVAYALRE